MDKGISYLNRNYQDYRDALIEMSKKYYPDLNVSFEDASVASWMIDLAADVADNLSYHIDRAYQETNIDSAHEKGSLYALARNCGVKIPGPKGAMAEVKITCTIPASNSEPGVPNWGASPIIKRGTRFSSASQSFELLNDVDFKNQFDSNGNSDRTYSPTRSTNGEITGYTVSKLAVVTAGETRVYRKVVHASDIEPFMEILLPVENVMNVESIVAVDGTGNTISPTYGVFYGNTECSGVTRFYEVDSLSQNEVWKESTDTANKPVIYTYTYDGTAAYSITRGEWKPVENKFITEFTDKGYLKITFGVGGDGGNVEIGNDATAFSKWQMSKILNNNNLGKLPKSESTIFILYRVGGGKASNVAKGAINKISSLNAEFRGTQEQAEAVMKSLSVTNTTPSVSGKDMPSEKELKYLIKYSNAAQERCVTTKDYIDRIMKLPPKYGTPFRVGVSEENNKIVIYLLGVDYQGHLDSALPIALIKNMEDYLSRYKMLNDYVEIKNGRIINLSFDINAIIDKNYNKSDVVTDIIETVKEYMDISSRLMGEEIYVGDLEKEISKIDGVINLISLKVYNEHGDGYSPYIIGQETISDEASSTDETDYLGDSERDLIDLEATDGILYNEGDTMMEIKYPSQDIRVRIKER